MSVLVRKNIQCPNKSQKTFGEYASYMKDVIQGELVYFDRINMVFDQYFDRSIKPVTRIRRVAEQHGKIYHIQGNTPLPTNLDTFLKNSENKKEFNQFLAKHLKETINFNERKLFIAT